MFLPTDVTELASHAAIRSEIHINIQPERTINAQPSSSISNGMDHL